MIADQFSGIDMKSLIGGPLNAAADASRMLNKATAEFIEKVGFDKKGVRTMTFNCDLKQPDREGGSNSTEIKIEVPLLAIVPIPSLLVEEVPILFDMEVKESTHSCDERSMADSSAAAADGEPLPANGKAGPEKTGELKMSHMKIKAEYSAAEETLKKRISQLKNAGVQQQKVFQDKLLSLIETARTAAEKQKYRDLLTKVNCGLDDFKANVEGLVWMLAVFAQAEESPVSEIFELEPIDREVLQAGENPESGDYYQAILEAVRAQQHLNRVEKKLKENNA